MGRATSKRNEAKSKNETPFRYVHAEIRTRVVVICDQTRYKLDHTEIANIQIDMIGRVSFFYKEGCNLSV